MTHPMRLRALAATCALVAGLATLAACGNGGTTATSKGGAGQASSTPTTAPSTPATTAASVQGLPEGFPKDQVPLLDEKVVNGVKGSAGGAFAWSVVMTSTRSIDDLSAEVSRAYATAGYKAGRSTKLGDVSIHQFSNATYQVDVTIARTGDGITVTYLVKKKA